jgi:tetratricopeptide (TPR) repeat protein
MGANKSSSDNFVGRLLTEELIDKL